MTKKFQGEAVRQVRVRRVVRDEPRGRSVSARRFGRRFPASTRVRGLGERGVYGFRVPR